jgi:ribosomal protein S18 acetylase RimI-like enzyme
VAEEHRRKGIAKALLDRFFQACRHIGIDIISLAVPAEEEAARKMYEGLGFEVRGYHLRRRL